MRSHAVSWRAAAVIATYDVYMLGILATDMCPMPTWPLAQLTALRLACAGARGGFGTCVVTLGSTRSSAAAVGPNKSPRPSRPPPEGPCHACRRRCRAARLPGLAGCGGEPWPAILVAW